MNRADINQILQDLVVRVKHVGENGWIAAHCPFAPYEGHPNGTDRDASLFIKIEPQGTSGYHCFTCKKKGRLSGMARALGHFRQEDYDSIAIDAELKEASGGVGDYDDRTSFMVQEPVPLPKEVYMGLYPSAFDCEAAMIYLRSRGITDEAIALLQLRYDPEEYRVLFPVLDFKQDLFGFTGRSILNQEQFDWINHQRKLAGRYVLYSRIRDYNFDKEFFLLGEHLIDRSKPIQTVEGLFALAHMISIGVRDFANPVASMGSALSRYQREILIDYGLPNYMFYDNDEAGATGLYGGMDGNGVRKGGGVVAKLAGHIPLLVPTYPDGKSDPDMLTLAEVSSMMDRAKLCGP